MEFYAVERKKELIPFATAWMELESLMLNEISQGGGEKGQWGEGFSGTTIKYTWTKSRGRV